MQPTIFGALSKETTPSLVSLSLPHRLKIKKGKNNLLQRFDASSLTLWKVRVDVDIDEVDDQIYAGAGQYQLDAKDRRRLRIGETILEVWPEPPPHNHHIFVGVPRGPEGLKYLPPAEVENLRLGALGCHYLLLHLLSMREPVAIQCAEFFYLFSEKGVEMYNGETTAWNFQIEGKLWALSDSKPEPGSRHPCPSFQWFSQQKHAFIVQATSPAEERKSTQIGHHPISNIDIKRFLGHFNKWGPSARTCMRLAGGSLTENELQRKATSAAKKFARDPAVVTMEASSQDDSHVLFTVTPIEDRSDSTLRVTTPYLCGLVVREIAIFDAAEQVSFYHRASDLPQFRGITTMYRKEYNPWGSLKHLEGHPFKGYSEKLFVINGDSNFADVKDTPFGTEPGAMFSSRIVRGIRPCCGNRSVLSPFERKVSIYSAVLDISKRKFSSKDVWGAHLHPVGGYQNEFVAMDTSGMEVVAEEEQKTRYVDFRIEDMTKVKEE
ncbi:hypothetical protein F5888DRAFT_1631557 [Russula emetica]|nr:hypothetical protein F5888DRAFT_1631557 [Russula emetica]